MVEIDEILRRQIGAKDVRVAGALTVPRSFGVYRLPDNVGATQRIRFGNHPVRERELAAMYGRCTRLHLFLARNDARAVARWLNQQKG